MIKAGNSDAGQRKAIIYFQGLIEESLAEPAVDIARRLRHSLEDHAPDIADKFSVTAYRNIDVQDNEDTWAGVSTIACKQSGADNEESLVDIIAVPYVRLLTQRYEEKKPITQFLTLVIQIIIMSLGFVTGIKRHFHDRRSHLQILYAGLILLTVLLYVPILGSAVMVSANNMLETMRETGNEGEAAEKADGTNPTAGTTMDADTEKDNHYQTPFGEEGLKQFFGFFVQWSEEIVVCLVALGLFTRRNFKQAVEEISKHMIAANRYLTEKHHRSLAIDYFGSLMQKLGEDPAINYTEIQLWGYSFGSVIAIDIIWPNDRDEAYNAAGLVDKIVTIGTPVQYIDRFYPGYFQNRVLPGDGRSRPEWTNIYCASDILSTQFKDDNKYTNIGLPDRQIKYGADPQTLDILRMAGYVTHGQYWDKQSLINFGAFHHLTPSLLPQGQA